MSVPARSVLKVTDNVPFGHSGQRNFFALSLESPQWADWEPGQFVMIRPVKWGADLTWARPLSLCRVNHRAMVLFFQVAGRGTEKLAQLRVDDEVLVWGPLGKGFAMEAKRPTLLLAGGIGIAPFAGYAENHPTPHSLVMLFGHRMPSDHYPTDSLARYISLENFLEKGPEDLQHFKNVVWERMKAYKERQGMVLSCGPLPFLRMVWKYAMELDIPTQLSLEHRMACGVGACLGCVATTSQHWADKEKAGLPVQTCTQGPVFWAKDIDLSQPV